MLGTYSSLLKWVKKLVHPFKLYFFSYYKNPQILILWTINPWAVEHTTQQQGHRCSVPGTVCTELLIFTRILTWNILTSAMIFKTTNHLHLTIFSGANLKQNTLYPDLWNRHAEQIFPTALTVLGFSIPPSRQAVKLTLLLSSRVPITAPSPSLYQCRAADTEKADKKACLNHTFRGLPWVLTHRTKCIASRAMSQPPPASTLGLYLCDGSPRVEMAG
jgi:hypothetical protein